MKLYIAEKPSLGRDVAKVLGKGTSSNGAITGDDWTMTWCLGHMFEPLMPESYTDKWAKWNIAELPMIPDVWRLEPRKDARAQIKVIKNLLSRADSVVNVGDPDREGQLLIDELLEELGWHGKTYRLWLPDLSTKGIQKQLGAIKDNAEYKGLFEAAQARQRADWLVGMNLTRAYTINARSSGHQGVLSVGRVQTPTLALVVERDLAIDKFVSKPFYEISASFSHSNGNYDGALLIGEDFTDEEGRLLDEVKAAELCKLSMSLGSGTVSNLEVVQKTNHQPLCYSIDDLTGVASKRYGMSAQEVLDLAQSLYETHKVTTYPRTDSGFLSENQLDDVSDIVSSLSSDDSLSPLIEGADFSIRSKTWNDAKANIAAHTAIIPTGDTTNIDKLNENELLLFRLIAERYLLQFYPPNIVEKTTFHTDVSDLTFKTSGTVTVQSGWKSAAENVEDNDEDNDAEISLIKVAEGDASIIQKATVITKTTTPPKRFTEGTLVATMKNIARYVEGDDLKDTLRDVKGIGTSATRPDIIEGLKKKGFLDVKGKNIISSPTAKAFIGLLPDDIKSAVTTALWEQELAKIETNDITLDQFMSGQQTYLRTALDNISGVIIGKPEGALDCPTCGNGILIRRKGKYGMAWFCSAYSDGCKSVFKDNRGKPILEKKEPIERTVKKCPHIECDGDAVQFSKKKGKGKFWICDSCDKAGRNKFLNDIKGSPVVQD